MCVLMSRVSRRLLNTAPALTVRWRTSGRGGCTRFWKPVLEDLSFGTQLGNVTIDGQYVTKKLESIVEDEDLSRYVL